LSPLTFRDIQTVKEVFVNKLLTVYHTRIAYPELRQPEQKNNRTNRSPCPTLPVSLIRCHLSAECCDPFRYTPIHRPTYSHSMVAGGLEEISYTTRFTPFTLWMISLETVAKKS